MTEISNTPTGGQQTRESSTDQAMPMWEQCRTAALPRLGQAMAMALAYVLGDLTEQLKQARDMHHHRLLEQAKDTLRHNRDGIVTSFQRRFTELAYPDATALSQPAEGQDELGLMSDSDIHDLASHDAIAQGIRLACDAELRGLDRRLRQLAKSIAQTGPANPLEPALISRAALVAMKERDVSLTLRRLITPMLAEHLALQVQTLYRDLIDLFADKGVFSSTPRSRQQASLGGIAGTEGIRVDEVTRQDHSAHRGQPVIAAITALTRLQQGAIQFSVTPRPGTTDALLQVRQAKFMTDLGNFGCIAVDMVTAHFEVILGDRRISTAIKGQIERLQLPMLKVALLEPAFLKSPDHPAHRLLATLVNTARSRDILLDMAAWQAEATAIADKISTHFQANVELFSATQAELEKRLTALQSTYRPDFARREEPALQALAGPDKSTFRKELTFQAQDQSLPKAILVFLFDHWETIYKAVYTQPRRTDWGLSDPSDTLTTLIRTLRPESWQEDRTTMLALLPPLLKRLKEGMQAAEVGQETQDKLLAGLAKCHALVIHGAQPNTAQSEVTSHHEPQRAAVQSAPAAAHPNDRSVEVQNAAKAKKDKYDALIKTLQRGTHIEFREAGGSMTWLKLAWISPNGGIFVFTNNLGERALTLNAAGLAERFRQDQAHVVQGSQGSEGAAGHLSGGLQRVA